MNKFFICFFAICFTLTAYAQNNVGIGTSTPDPSAVLDLTSNSKGFLVPRTKVGFVTTPATGLVIFDTDTNCYVMYNGTAWQNLCSPQLPPQHLGFNDSIRINPDGTITVIDSGGNHLVTTLQSAWTTLGNSGTNSAVNFAGTTDAQDFVLKSNSNEVIRATQSGAVGINTPVPNPTSILDITSTTRGVLFPALTSAQRDAIVGPAVGLTIYDTDLNVHQFWNGTCWVNVGQTVCSFTYNTTQSQTQGCLFKSNFGSVSDTLTISLVSGTASPVILSAAGVPAGVLVSFSNNYTTPTATSIMTFTALPSAPNGTYPITVLAVSGSTIQTLTYTLTVYDLTPALSSIDTTITLAAAQSGGVVATSTITVGNNSGCVATATTAQLSASINPANPGLLVSFANSSIPVPGSTTMSITATCALQGTYTITITSQIGSSVSTATYTITILGPAPIHISANTQNVNLYTLAGSPACAVNDTFIVDAGVTVGSDTANHATPAAAAIETGPFRTGSVIVLINYGTIEGAGGKGGSGDGYGGTILGGACPYINGAQGGDAIWVNTANVTIDNFGTIASGGGGGGAGQALGVTACTIDVRPGTGGGGGAGSVGGPGGGNAGGSYPCAPGNPGTLAAGGTGGTPCQIGPCTQLFFTFGPYNAGQGGTGGAPGQPGQTGNNNSGLIGGTGVCAAGSGGSPGFAIVGGGNSPVFNGTPVVGPTTP